MDVVFNGVLLRRQPETIESHWVQDVKAPHPFVAAVDVAGDVPFGMADVEPRAAWIGKHVEDVALGLAAIKPGLPRSPRLIGLLLLPMGPPFGFDGLEIVLAFFLFG